MVQSKQDKKFHSIMKKLNSKIEEFEETNKALGIKKKKGDTVLPWHAITIDKSKGNFTCCRCCKKIKKRWGLCPECKADKEKQDKEMKEKGQTWQY